MLIQRCIGRYKGHLDGPLVIGFGAVHGNEPAGVLALREVFRLLEYEPRINPKFEFRGAMIGLVGNLSAYITGERFLVKDLNRMWSKSALESTQKTPHQLRHVEQRELISLMHHIYEAVRTYRPKQLILLDLHTTSAADGIFSIPDGTIASQELARQLPAPVVQGLLGGIGQTMLHFIREGGFSNILDNCPESTIGLAFEGGQHEDPLSVSRCVAATVNCLRAAGCIHPNDVDSKHDAILNAFSKNLPKVLELQYVHHIDPELGFKMRPGYRNFQRIQEGEHLDDSKIGPICAKNSGRILMPLYQSRGTDGFFVVKEV